MSTIKIKFIFDRKHQSSSIKQGKVDLRITYLYKQKFLYTGIAVLPHQWDEVNECVKGTIETPYQNKILQGMKQKAFKYYTDMLETGEVDINEMINALKAKDIDMTFLEYVEVRSNARVVEDGTRKHYVTFLKALNEWGKITTFADITASSIRNFDEWLHGRDLKQSTIYDYHKNMKMFINDAMVDGYIHENPYAIRRIKIERGGKERVDSLTEEKVEAIRNLPLSGFLDKARDLFIFQCYTGLAYVDMMKFDINSFKTIDSGLMFGSALRTKTGTEFSLVLLHPALEVLAKYDNKIPRLSNQKYNAYLKAIGAMVGEPTLHSHAGRGSFASLMLNHGIPIDVLQHMIGHKDRKQTQRYASMRDKTVIDGFKSVLGDIEKMADVTKMYLKCSLHDDLQRM